MRVVMRLKNSAHPGHIFGRFGTVRQGALQQFGHAVAYKRAALGFAAERIAQLFQRVISGSG